MELICREEQGVVIVAVQGDFDSTHGLEFRALIDHLLLEGRRHIVIDLQHVDFIDSSGLAVLISSFKRVRSDKAMICFAALQPAVRRIFELTRLERAMDIQPDVVQAIQFLTTRK
jgi:anti-sigma B factor antagonist